MVRLLAKICGAAALLFLMLSPHFVHAFELDDPDFPFDETIFEYGPAGGVFAPRALRQPGPPPESPLRVPEGWTQDGGDAYAAFDAAEVFPSDEGSLELELVVLDPAGLAGLTDKYEALVTLYDDRGTAFFTVGINAEEVTVGSFPLHPVEMEDVFGGLSFDFVPLIGGSKEKGTTFRICVQWGRDPDGNRFYVNGERVPAELIEGARNMGPPGYEPTKTLGEFMHGFTASDAKTVVGPADRFVVGRIGLPASGDQLGMLPPTSVGIVRVRTANSPLYD